MANNLEVNRSRKQNEVDSFSGTTPFDQMINRFFGDRVGALFGGLPEVSRNLQSRFHETENAYCLTADIPGIPKENVEINVNGNMLTIRAEHREENEQEGERGFSRQYRSFHQSFTLPTSVDPEKIEAHAENGVLEVVIPKTGETKSKKIEVQSGKGGLMNRRSGSVKRDDKKSGDGEAKH